MIDYSKFRLSLRRLEERYNDFQTLDPTIPQWLRESVSESVVQRFETCYDCLWKVLKRYLADDLGFPNPPNSPKPLFRLAAENDLLRVPVEEWFRYAASRTGTAHDYDTEKAQACLELMPNFIEDAIGLYQTMSGETWE